MNHASATVRCSRAPSRSLRVAAAPICRAGSAESTETALLAQTFFQTWTLPLIAYIFTNAGPCPSAKLEHALLHECSVRTKPSRRSVVVCIFAEDCTVILNCRRIHAYSEAMRDVCPAKLKTLRRGKSRHGETNTRVQPHAFLDAR